MDPVVSRGEQQRAARDRNGGCAVQCVVLGIDRNVAAVDGKHRLRLNALCAVRAGAARLNRDRAAVDQHVSLRCILAVFADDAVPAGDDVDRSAANGHAVLADDAVGNRVHLQREIGDYHVVLADDAEFIVAVDRERARAVEGQIAAGEDRTVGIVAKRIGCIA